MDEIVRTPQEVVDALLRDHFDVWVDVEERHNSYHADVVIRRGGPGGPTWRLTLYTLPRDLLRGTWRYVACLTSSRLGYPDEEEVLEEGEASWLPGDAARRMSHWTAELVQRIAAGS